VQINWHVFRPLTITESHVSHAPTSHDSASEIAHVLEWVIPLEEMVVGVVCEDYTECFDTANFISAYLYTSKIVCMTKQTDENTQTEDFLNQKRDRIEVVVCDTSQPPIKTGGVQTLIVLALSETVPINPLYALSFTSKRLVLVASHTNYLRSISDEIRKIDGSGVGYIGHRWVLLSISKL